MVATRVSRVALLIAALCSMALPHAARAQSTNATVSGTITDANGGVLPGVTVTAINQQTGLTRAVVTGERGAYQLNALPPGTYSLKAELSGFAVQTRANVVLGIGTAISMNFTMKLASLTESVTVTGAAPLVDTTTSKVSTAITPQEVDQLPLVGRQFMDLANLAPGVSIDNTTANSGSDNVAFGGFGEEDKAEYLEGMDINDGDTRGGSGLSQASRHDFTQETVQEFQVLSTGYSVEFGRSATGVLNILTKSGTNTFHGRGYYFLRDHSFQKPNAFAKGNPPFRQQQSGGTVGGPVRQDKAWFFLTYENDYENSSAAVNVPAFVLPIITDPRTNVPQPVRKNNLFGKLTTSLSGTEYLNITGLLNRETLDNQDLGGNIAGDGGDNKIYHDEFLNAGLTSTFSNNMTNEVKLAVSDALKIRPQNGPLTPEVAFPSIQYGTHTNYPQNRDQKNVTLADTLHLHKETGAGTHDFKFGGMFNYVKLWNYHEDTTQGIFTFLQDELPVPGEPSTYPVSFVIRTKPAGVEYINPSSYSAFAEDAWRPRSNVTVTVGVRWDGMRFYDKGAVDAPTNMSKADFLIGFVNGTLPEGNNYKPFKNTNDIAPRVSVAWDPNNDGKTVVRAAYGYYYGYSGDNTASRTMDAYPLGSTVTYGNDVRVSGIPNTFFPNVPPISQLAQSAGSASVFVATPGTWYDPMTIQSSIGVDRQIGPSTSFSVDYVHITGRHFLLTYNINARLPDGTYPLVPSGITMNYNDPAGKVRSNQVQFHLTQRVFHNLSFQASYTFMRFFETQTPVNVQDIYANNWGPGPNDVRHRFVFSGTYQLPANFQIGAIVNATSAPPYNVITGVDNNGDRNVNDRPIVNGVMVEPYSARGDSYFRTDMRVSRTFKMGGARTFELLWEMDNIFNTVNYGGYNGNMKSKLFGQPTFALTPFQGQLGLRFNF